MLFKGIDITASKDFLDRLVGGRGAFPKDFSGKMTVYTTNKKNITRRFHKTLTFEKISTADTIHARQSRLSSDHPF